MQKVVVKFTRTYTVDEGVILAHLQLTNKPVSYKNIEEAAKEIATMEFGGEFEFLNESTDNFSCKAEIIK